MSRARKKKKKKETEARTVSLRFYFGSCPFLFLESRGLGNGGNTSFTGFSLILLYCNLPAAEIRGGKQYNFVIRARLEIFLARGSSLRINSFHPLDLFLKYTGRKIESTLFDAIWKLGLFLFGKIRGRRRIEKVPPLLSSLSLRTSKLETCCPSNGKVIDTFPCNFSRHSIEPRFVLPNNLPNLYDIFIKERRGLSRV